MTRAKGDLTAAAKRELRQLAETGAWNPRYGPWKQLIDAGLVEGGGQGNQAASTITERGKERVRLWKHIEREDRYYEGSKQ